MSYRLPPRSSLHESPSVSSAKLKFDYHPPHPPIPIDLYLRRNTEGSSRRDELSEDGIIGKSRFEEICGKGINGIVGEEGIGRGNNLHGRVFVGEDLIGRGGSGIGGGALFDKIMKIVDGKLENLENRIMKNEEGILANEGLMRGQRDELERVTRTCRDNEKMIEKGLGIVEQTRKAEEEEKGRKLDALIAKITSVESRVQLVEDKLNRFNNQMEMKMSGVTQELQNTLNKVVKHNRDINGKIETIYESPQLVFQKLITDYERTQSLKNPVDFDQKILMISEDFKLKIKEVYKTLDEIGLWAKQNNEDLNEQKGVLGKIEEDFLRMLTFYKELNEDIIRVKAGQEDLIFVKNRLGELEGMVERGGRNRK